MLLAMLLSVLLAVALIVRASPAVVVEVSLATTAALASLSAGPATLVA